MQEKVQMDVANNIDRLKFICREIARLDETYFKKRE